MAKFKVIKGVHYEGEVRHEEGVPFECDRPLDVLYANKFERVEDAPAPQPVQARRSKKEIEEDDKKPREGGEAFAKEPTEEERDAALSGGDARPEVEKEQRTPRAEFAKPAENRPEIPDDDDEDDDEEGEEADVTADFPQATQNDLTVHKSRAGYTVHEGKKALTEQPLRDKRQVTKFLKEHLEE